MLTALSGKNFRKPASLAGQIPRSVIKAVTSRAGVTSNAKFLIVCVQEFFHGLVLAGCSVYSPHKQKRGSL